MLASFKLGHNHISTKRIGVLTVNHTYYNLALNQLPIKYNTAASLNNV